MSPTLALPSSAAAGTSTVTASFTRPQAPATSLFNPFPSPSFIRTSTKYRKLKISCDVALTSSSDSETSTSSSPAGEDAGGLSSRIGERVRVTVPLKVYHVPRVPEVDLTGMEGVLKQDVSFWKGKHVSANLPFKVQFVKEIEGRGPVKFFAHLREDEFEFV